MMVLLGGLNALAGPSFDAATLTWARDLLARSTEYWRALLGATILLIVLVFPLEIGGAVGLVLHEVRAKMATSGPVH